MPEPIDPSTEPIHPSTVPSQPVGKPPIKSAMPIVLTVTGVIVLVGASTAWNVVSGHAKEAPKSTMQNRPNTANPQQVTGFEKTQAQITKSDEENARVQAAMAALQARDQNSQNGGIPAPEADPSMPMTPAQSAAIYGSSPNAPHETSVASEARAQAAQAAAERARKREIALNSDTVAVDFAQHEQAFPAGHTAPPQATEDVASTLASAEPGTGSEKDTPPAAPESSVAAKEDALSKPARNPMAAYDFDHFDGKLFRVFEGTVFEGVVTNHIDGSSAGPILIMLTTDYYSHDHQQLLLPQGTRLIGEVGAVSSQQQHKLIVSFHRAVCPDGFSIDLDKYAGLDPLGTTGLATRVDHDYLTAFAAAAAVGGLGGLAQIGNSGSSLTTDSQIRNGLSSQTSMEGEQILNHFLNRLPIITLKEGSRARVYVGKDLLIPSYADHRVNPTL